MLSHEDLEVLGVNISIVPIINLRERLLIIELFVALEGLLLCLSDSVEVDLHFQQFRQLILNSGVDETRIWQIWPLSNQCS